MKRFAKIGAKLKELRGQLSQEEFAKKIGVPFRTYQRYESGERMPKADVVQRIAQACGVPVDSILAGESITERAEEEVGPLDNVSRLILLMLKDMPEEKRRDVLKYAEAQKLLSEYQAQKKKRKGAG